MLKVMILLVLAFASQALCSSDNDPLGLSNYETLAQWKMHNGETLVVCNLNGGKPDGKDNFVGWINIYEHSMKGISPFISEVTSELPSDHYTFAIEKMNASKVLITRKLISTTKEVDGEGDIAVTQATIDCSTKPCKMGKEKCLPFKDKKPDLAAIRKVKAVMKDQVQPDQDEEYDITIGKLIDSALAGNKEALKLVLESSDRLKLDGAAAESFTDGQRLVSNLVELKCIKK